MASLRFKPDNSERRYIIVRKLSEEYPKSGGKLLFDEPIYRYSAYVTNIELLVDQIYNPRLCNRRSNKIFIYN